MNTYITVIETAELFNVTRQTIYNWAKNPAFPDIVYHMPGANGFVRAEIEAYYNLVREI